MSEAPLWIASSSTLFTNRTTGASSESTRVASGSSVSPSSTPRLSSETSSRPAMALSSALNALSIARASLSCSTSTGSMLSPVLNWNSSRAARLVGSATARNRLRPRWKIGSAPCLRISDSDTFWTGAWARSIARRSSSGIENSSHAALARTAALSRPRFTTRATNDSSSRTASRCACAAVSASIRPSSTSCRARPPRAGDDALRLFIAMEASPDGPNVAVLWNGLPQMPRHGWPAGAEEDRRASATVRILWCLS